MKFDLVTACYNPLPDWGEKFVSNYADLQLLFENAGASSELTIVNDGSLKNFEKGIGIVRQHIPSVKVISYNVNKGKGYALREGVKTTEHEYCIYCDHDFPFGIEAVLNIAKALIHGADIAAGCRKQGNYFKSIPLKRIILSKALLFFNKWILRLSIADTQAGLKGFNRYGKMLFLETKVDRFLFDLEFILSANRFDDIVLSSVDVNFCETAKLSNFRMKVLRQEVLNLLKIIFAKRDERQIKADIVWYRPRRV